jgi:hypothetical protein
MKSAANSKINRNDKHLREEDEEEDSYDPQVFIEYQKTDHPPLLYYLMGQD